MVQERLWLNEAVNDQNQNLAFIGKVLQPSWLSGLIDIAVSVALVVGTLISATYSSSGLRYLIDQEKQRAQQNYAPYTPLPDHFSSNQLLGDIPLLIFWMGVGLVAYWFMSAVLVAWRDAAELKEELDYVHVDRRALVRQAAERLGLRAIVLIGWVLYIAFTLRVLLPYILALATAAKGAGSALPAIGFGLLAVGLAALVLHIHLICLRLLWLRSRLITG